MLKVVMASPVPDALHQGQFARTLQYHLVEGDYDSMMKIFEQQDAKWMQFKRNDGTPIFVNIEHISWIEVLSERRQNAHVS